MTKVPTAVEAEPVAWLWFDSQKDAQFCLVEPKARATRQPLYSADALASQAGELERLTRERDDMRATMNREIRKHQARADEYEARTALKATP